MAIKVKICGLKTAEAVRAAVDGGAAYVGFVFFPPSPRNLMPEEAAPLAGLVPPEVKRVGLFVDASDAVIKKVLDACPLDMLQLHGEETRARVSEVRSRFGLPVIKALPVAAPEDLGKARAFEGTADMLLFDAKPPEGATRPGGNALAFDWRLLKQCHWGRPWLLAGGLHIGNLAEAVRISGAPGVDVSSGVESAPGVKNPEAIRDFLALAAGL